MNFIKLLYTGCIAMLVALGAIALHSEEQDTTPPSHLADPFAPGWLVTDTNGDGIADFVPGKIVVPASPTAAENAAAANLAARLGYGTTGLTLPLVVTQDPGTGPRIFVGRAASAAAMPLTSGEGAVY